MKKILANSAVLSLILVLVLGLTMTSCKKSDEQTMTDVKTTLDAYTKAITEFDTWAKGQTLPTDPAQFEGFKQNVEMQYKKVTEAIKKWADNYDKVWKTKLQEADFTNFEKTKADLDAKAKAAYDGINKKFEDAKKAAAAAPPADQPKEEPKK